MKITIAQGAFLPVPPVLGGGVEKVWFALGQEFVRRGHHVRHISKCHDGFPISENIGGVHHCRVPGFATPKSIIVNLSLDFIYSLRVLRKLEPADILVTNTFWLPMIVRSKSLGKLCVHVARLPKGQMRLYSHAARLQAVSRAVKIAIASQAPNCESKVVVIPNYLTDHWFEPLTVKDEDREPTILYVGRVHPEKGLHLLIEAFALLKKKNNMKWRLKIVGPISVSEGGGGQDYEHKLQRLAQTAQSEIDWIGPTYDVTELIPHFDRASIFVYPSIAEKGESFGLAPLEAMSRGCPTIVSNLTCFQEFLKAGVNGLVFDHRRHDAAERLASLIEDLIRDQKRRGELQKEGLLVAKEFSVNNIASLYLEDFQGLAKVKQP